MSTKKRTIKVFETFGTALKNLETQDGILYSWPRNRIALSHALAQHLQELVSKQDQSLCVDMCPVLNRSSKAINPDILVHNRQTGLQALAVVCRNEYLTESEQEDLIRFRESSRCELILALSFMVQKNYMLIYVATEDRIEYYHFDRNSLTIEPVRKRDLGGKQEDKDQLTLDRMLKKH